MTRLVISAAGVVRSRLLRDAGRESVDDDDTRNHGHLKEFLYSGSKIRVLYSVRKRELKQANITGGCFTVGATRDRPYVNSHLFI